MERSFEEVVQFIQGRNVIQLGLDHIKGFLEEIGNPHLKLKIIHIAGTNGKGSTLNFMREMLMTAKYQVGAFTTPAVISYEEQISVNSESISQDEFVKLFQQLTPAREQFEQREQVILSEFECLTAMMFYYFANIRPVDFVLVEAGVGGRLDATNVAFPLLSVITNVGTDHTLLLGETKEEIALEKAGIIKPGIPLITAEEDGMILSILKKQTTEKQSKLYVIRDDFSIENNFTDKGLQSFSFKSPFRKIDHIKITMQGEHQLKNAATALMVIEYLKTYQALLILEEEIRKALKQAAWVGRFEKISGEPLIYIDGAHNNEGIEALAEILRNSFAEKKISVMFAATKEKDIETMLAPLYEIIDDLTFTSFEFPRAAHAADVYHQSHFSNKKLTEDWKSEIDNRLSTLNENDLFLITGSLYFIGQVRAYLLNQKK